MFRRFVSFRIKKWDATRVIDALSKYRSTIAGLSDLNIVDSGLKDGEIYYVSLHCKRDELKNCLDDITRLNRKGMWIDKLYVR